jgi:hypothetical protein
LWLPEGARSKQFAQARSWQAGCLRCVLRVSKKMLQV